MQWDVCYEVLDMEGVVAWFSGDAWERFTGPVARLTSQIPEDVLDDASGYTQAIYRFAQRYSVGARYEYGSPARGREGRVASDPLDPEWTEARPDPRLDSSVRKPSMSSWWPRRREPGGRAEPR